MQRRFWDCPVAWAVVESVQDAWVARAQGALQREHVWLASV